MAMGKGPQCNAAAQSIFLICVISTLAFPIDCSDTKRATCAPGLCQHGICYRTTKSITVGGEIDSDKMQCPDGFDKHKAFCFRLDLVKQSWLNAYEYSEETGILATIFQKKDVNTAAEYLRSKLSDDHAPVWIDLLLNHAHAVPNHQPRCTALEPANYTRWQTQDCESELYSLRTGALSNPTPSHDIMCRCHPGYTGVYCDIINSAFSSQELTNPDALQCPGDTLILVEFALDGYEANNTTGMDRFATSTLAILRSVCQGKNSCNLQPFNTETAFYNKPPNATLVVRHSCVNASDMYCHSSALQKDGKSVNCLLPTYRNISWDTAYYYCFQKGGHLAAFNSGIQCVSSSGIANVLNSSTSFWNYDDLLDDRGQDEWAMAIANHQSNTSYLAVAKECSQQFPGICVVPPFHQDTTTHIADYYELSPTAQPHTSTEADLDPLYSLVLLPIAGAIAGIVKYYRHIQETKLLDDISALV